MTLYVLDQYALMLGTSNTAQQSLVSSMWKSLQKEVPKTLEVCFERFCNLQCDHCLYWPENSSGGFRSRVEQSIRAIADILSHNGTIIHGGRIVRKWHLELLNRIHGERPDIRFGLIDSGLYTRHLEEFDRLNLKLDILMLSVDGTPGTHNKQRDPRHRLPREHSGNPWRLVLDGFKQSQLVLRPGGLVTSLMTVTSHNYQEIGAVAKISLSELGADEFHITPMKAIGAANQSIKLSDQEFLIMWKEVQKAFSKHNDETQKVFFKLESAEHLSQLASVVGKERLLKVLQPDHPDLHVTGAGHLIFRVDGVLVSFFPVSLWPHEAFYIDSDGALRLAFAGKYTLSELQTQEVYTVREALKGNESLEVLFEETYSRWRSHFANHFFMQEKEVFEDLRS